MQQIHTPPSQPSDLPTEFVESMTDFSDAQLQSAVHYAQDLLDYRHSPTANIEPREGEEIVRLEERDEYTLVVVRRYCAEECEDCPHGPFAYHVSYEPSLEGDGKFRWRYIGQVGPIE